MRQLYLEYKDHPNLLRLVREIPTRPMGVAEYYLTRQLPPELAGNLPSAEELERELKSELDLLDE